MFQLYLLTAHEPSPTRRQGLAKTREQLLPLPGERAGVRAGLLDTNFAGGFMGNSPSQATDSDFGDSDFFRMSGIWPSDFRFIFIFDLPSSIFGLSPLSPLR